MGFKRRNKNGENRKKIIWNFLEQFKRIRKEKFPLCRLCQNVRFACVDREKVQPSDR